MQPTLPGDAFQDRARTCSKSSSGWVRKNTGEVPANSLICEQQGLTGPACVAAGGIPALSFNGFDPGVKWDNLMIRAGATYTLGKSKRTLIRANIAQYVDTISNGDVGYNNPVAVSSVGYPWADNGDELVQVSELDTTTPVCFVIRP